MLYRSCNSFELEKIFFLLKIDSVYHTFNGETLTVKSVLSWNKPSTYNKHAANTNFHSIA